MYNSKRFETVKNMRENKKISNAVQAAIGVLAVVLAALIVWMMVLVSGIQGTARVVNYAGLVRGKTQRLVKMTSLPLCDWATRVFRRKWKSWLLALKA